MVPEGASGPKTPPGAEQVQHATAETPYQLIDTPEAWAACLAALKGLDRIALDIESNSLYVYREYVCLIQLSTPAHDYVIDPLAGFPLDGLKAIIEDPKVEKVFHASEYDLILLKRDYCWNAVNIFDTMWAARILSYSNMGLAYFLKEFYGVSISKKYQKTNWARRPLSREQLEYAYMDTHYLLRLRDDLASKLIDRGLLEEAREIFENEAKVRVPERKFDPQGFWSLRGVRELPPAARSIVAALYAFRDQEAKRRDLPPFKIFMNEVLLLLAEAAPRTLEELQGLRGVPDRVRQYYGKTLVRLIQAARKEPAPKPPQRTRLPESDILDRYDKLQHWRKETAQQRGVESDVVLTREAMWAIANLNPKDLTELKQVPSFGPRRLALYGELILKQLR